MRLTFSDPYGRDNGRISYAASADDPETDHVAGSALGYIDPNGTAALTAPTDLDGGRLTGKTEGPAREGGDPRRVHFVVDKDDETFPSALSEAALGGGFFG